MQDSFAGRHLIMDLVTKRENLLNNTEHADNYMYEITEITKMQLVIPVISMKFPFNTELVGLIRKLEGEGTSSPIIKEYKNYVDLKENNDVGVSSIGIWNTSHCCSHSWKKDYYISIDLFSCSDYNITPVLDFTVKHYQAERVDVLNIERYIGQPQKIHQFAIHKNI